ncbi:hypothetical protein E2C01_052112 [Portunus trituberculatus]|uniref:Uncharacterized protein n=1 Tax=Portunus trituberculatus TaxID=210409 RepID=A0A5B7GLH9_PORTR|nr:hypothetical protein [Portunus trituberculatus]
MKSWEDQYLFVETPSPTDPERHDNIHMQDNTPVARDIQIAQAGHSLGELLLYKNIFFGSPFL